MTRRLSLFLPDPDFGDYPERMRAAIHWANVDLVSRFWR
jgi:hypothetical protein